MTTEGDFQVALDADPSDWQTRLVFADWLQERDDPRAEWYRVSGTYRKRPRYYQYNQPEPEWTWWCFVAPVESNIRPWEATVPWVLFDALVVPGETRYEGVWFEKNAATRWAAEDAAALAFYSLTSSQRAEVVRELRERFELEQELLTKKGA